MVNLASGAQGALTGAAAGTAFGGPPGAVVGGIIGGVTGLFGGGTKKKKKPKKVSTLDPMQKRVYKDYVDSLRGKGPYADLYNFNEEGYNNVFDQTIGRPAYRNFQENIIPGITGQFRQNNLMNSSYTGEALSRAGRDVQENLDAQRSANIFQGQQQAQNNKQNAINSILGTQTFAYEKPGAQNPNGIDQILGTLGPQAGEWFADYLKDKRANSGTSQPSSPASTPMQSGQSSLPQSIIA